MTTNIDLCQVCRSPINSPGRTKRKYCSPGCSQKAQIRRYRNQPIADPVITPEEAHAFQTQLRATEHENRRLRKLITRMRTIARKHHAQARNAQNRIAHAQRNEEHAQLRMRALTTQRLEAAQARNAELESELLTLRKASEELETLRTNQEISYTYAQELSVHYHQEIGKLQQALAQAQDAAKNNSRLINDYLFFAPRYLNGKSRELWDRTDHERATRYSTIYKARRKK